MTRVGVKPVLIAGMIFLTAGLACFTQVSVGGSCLGDLLPGFLLVAMGMGFSIVPISIAALAGVEPSEAGLINTSRQTGGALGIAALPAVATSTAGDATGPEALTDGFRAAFAAGTAVALAGVLVALLIVRGCDLARAAPSSLVEGDATADGDGADDGLPARGPRASRSAV